MDDDRLQLYVTKRGKVVIRRPPRGEPTEAQRHIRQEFALAALSAAGRKRADLPPAADAVRDHLAGVRFSSREDEPGWQRVLRAWLRERGYSEAEAEILLTLTG